MSDRPAVSVVIPTLARPALVMRAVRSALAQTLTDIEVIVVIDGPGDEQTPAALAAITDARLRVVVLPEQGGAPNARNVGVSEALAPWTALLDDDDEWLPTKLATQLALAESAGVRRPIVASRLINRTPRAEFVMPRRLPSPGEPLSEYLTVRRGLFHGDGFIQTSTIMAPTELLRQVKFTVGLRRFQELDWTLRALGLDGVDLVYPVEPLVVWHTDEDRPRISFQSPWQQSIAWLEQIRPLITRRAYAALAMSVVASTAAPTRRWSLFRSLLADARRHGDPRFVDYVTYLQVWLLPPGLRRQLRDMILRRRSAAVPAPDADLGTPAAALLTPATGSAVPAPDVAVSTPVAAFPGAAPASALQAPASAFPAADAALAGPDVAVSASVVAFPAPDRAARSALSVAGSSGLMPGSPGSSADAVLN